MEIHGNWIFGPDSKPYDWWILRRRFSAAKLPRKAILRISSLGGHTCYINGKEITRGPARSFDFDKSYDTVDVTRFLQEGANGISVLSMHLERGGVFAQLLLDDVLFLETDGTWKANRNPCFCLEASCNSAPLEPMKRMEEQYDARVEECWYSSDYGDEGWAKAEIVGEIGKWPFLHLSPNEGGLLSEDLALGKQLVALGFAAEPKKANRLRFQGANRSRLDCYRVQVQAPEEETLCLHSYGASEIYINGNPASGTARLHSGANELVAVNSFGDLELWLDTEASLNFGKWTVHRQDMDMTQCAWHAWDSCEKLAELPGAEETEEAAPPCDCSVAFSVEHQQFVQSADGFADPSLGLGASRSQESVGAVGLPNMLHTNHATTWFDRDPARDVTFILDMGEEYLGNYTFRLRAGSGTIVDLVGFEQVGPTGIVWMHSNAMRYICKEGWQEYTCQGTHGFRYLSVTLRNRTQPVEIEYIGVCHRAFAMEEVGSFACDDPEVTDIFRMCIDTAKLCMQDTYIDCPGYEQVYWVGDAKITSHVNLLCAGGYAYDQNSIRLIGKSLSPDFTAMYKAQDPRYRQEKNLVLPAYSTYVDGGLPLFAFNWVLQCWDHFWYGGSLDDLRTNYRDVAVMLEHAFRWINDRGLVEMTDAWDLLDWGNNDVTSYGETLANSICLAKCCDVAADMASALGREGQAQYRDQARKLREAVNRYGWNEERSAYVDTVRDEKGYAIYTRYCRKRKWSPLPYSQYRQLERVSRQTNTIAYLYDCVPPERRKAVEALILASADGRYIKGSPSNRSLGRPSDQEAPHGVVEIGTPMFLYYSFAALAKMGCVDSLLPVIKRDFGRMLRCGTKTCWETFPISDTEWTRSICHAWSASPAVYLLTEILGVKPLEPGFTRFTVTPHPGHLQSMRGSVATPYGPIFVIYENGALTVNPPAQCQWIQPPCR